MRYVLHQGLGGRGRLYILVEVEVVESQCLLQASFVDIRPLLR